MLTLPKHSITCDSPEPCCPKYLAFWGYTEGDRLITAAVARRMAKERGWHIAPKRHESNGKIYGWSALCPEHKDQTKVEG